MGTPLRHWEVLGQPRAMHSPPGHLLLLLKDPDAPLAGFLIMLSGNASTPKLPAWALSLLLQRVMQQPGRQWRAARAGWGGHRGCCKPGPAMRGGTCVPALLHGGGRGGGAAPGAKLPIIIILPSQARLGGLPKPGCKAADSCCSCKPPGSCHGAAPPPCLLAGHLGKRSGLAAAKGGGVTLEGGEIGSLSPSSGPDGGVAGGCLLSRTRHRTVPRLPPTQGFPLGGGTPPPETGVSQKRGV